MEVRIFPSPCQGAIRVPPSKSAAHRAILCAALAGGTSRIQNLRWSQDILATLDAVEALGAHVQRGDDWVSVEGVGFPRAEGSFSVDCRESGSTLRFLIPLCSLTGQPARLTGSPRLLERPQSVYEEIFHSQGIPFSASPEGIRLEGCLRPGSYRLRGDVSSQFVTGLLLALPLLPGGSTLELLPPVESRSYIQMTLEILGTFGVKAFWKNETTLEVPGSQTYRPCPAYTVEGDYSQAAFWGALGAINGPVDCLGLGENSAQGDRVFFTLLNRRGGRLTTLPHGVRSEPAPLSPQEIDLADCPDLGPILTALSVFAPGESRIFHAARLRLKESDRIAAMEEELTRMGASLRSSQDEIRIRGTGSLEGGCTVSSHNDHRIAMSLAVASTVCRQPVTITQAEAVNKSYPDFWKDLASLGVRMDIY